MSAACTGDTVKIHFTGRLADGTVFVSSADGEPVEFCVGDGSLIKGLDDCVVGMSVGERRKISVAPEDGYGERIPELVATVPRAELPNNLEPNPGDIFQVKLPNGEAAQFLIVAVDDDSITLDGNHPFAGQQLEFEVELLAIN